MVQLKRPLPSQSTQSTQSSNSSQSPKRHASRPNKRLRTTSPQPQPPLEPQLQAIQSESIKHLPPPKKRTKHSGTLRRLTNGHPSTSSTHSQQPASRSKQTLNGSRIGGKSKDLKDGIETEDLWVKNPKKGRDGNGNGRGGGGMGFSAYLKQGVAAFVERGCTCLRIHGMAATIPLALTLALAIRDGIPGGGSPVMIPSHEDEDVETVDEEEDNEEEDGLEKEGGEKKGNNGGGVVKMEVKTGTTIVGDEITPSDEDEEMIYQTRSKSTVEIILTLDPVVAPLVGIGSRSSVRGRGGGGGRGRGGGKRGGRGRGK